MTVFDKEWNELLWSVYHRPLWGYNYPRTSKPSTYNVKRVAQWIMSCNSDFNDYGIAGIYFTDNDTLKNIELYVVDKTRVELSATNKNPFCNL